MVSANLLAMTNCRTAALLTILLPLLCSGWLLAPIRRQHSPYFPITHRQIRATQRRFPCRLRATLPTDSESWEPWATPKLDLQLVVIDHYDSFTYNLVDMLAQLCAHPPIVVAADAADSWSQFVDDRSANADSPSRKGVDGIVLSPGPGHPLDVPPLSRSAVLENPDVPILGVCLGHQILGTLYGATCTNAPTAIHGQVWPVHLLDDRPCPLWQSFVDRGQRTFDVTRYHSLQVIPSSSSLSGDWGPLIPTAITDDDEKVVMAMRHKNFPHFGVQFHPESIGTADGMQLLRQFCSICVQKMEFKGEERSPLPSYSMRSTPQTTPVLDEETHDSVIQRDSTGPNYNVYIHHVGQSALRPQDVMDQLLAPETSTSHRFWLDDSKAGDKTTATSLLGCTRDDRHGRVEYWGKDKPKSMQGVHVWENVDYEHHVDLDILNYLDQQHSNPISNVAMVSWNDGDHGRKLLAKTYTIEKANEQLPFSFRGGHIGFLGYEVRHDTERYLAEKENGRLGKSDESLSTNLDTRRYTNPQIPTAAFLFADRTFVFDHLSCEWYLVGVAASNSVIEQDRVFQWMQSASHELKTRNPLDGVEFPDERHDQSPSLSASVTFVPNRPRETYTRNFEACLESIRQGDSYELCLTNQLEADVTAPESKPLDLYRILRQSNPAPFSAFFDWDGEASRLDCETRSSFAICCSSPERFVSVKRNTEQQQPSLKVEAKPIKGTAARVLPSDGRTYLTAKEDQEDLDRATELQRSQKNRAENLMIVDLLRNDLSRVCDAGTVHVAKLMDIESYATVHQMVSTIQGTLSNTSSAVDVLKCCFPGGSMTGAPKIRTMELLDEMEEGSSRGPYSGCLGYISLDGSLDMNIVIRTAVLSPIMGSIDTWRVSIGAGGAITALSDDDDEYNEMILKASAVMNATTAWARSAWKTLGILKGYSQTPRFPMEQYLAKTNRSA